MSPQAARCAALPYPLCEANPSRGSRRPARAAGVPRRLREDRSGGDAGDGRVAREPRPSGEPAGRDGNPSTRTKSGAPPRPPGRRVPASSPGTSRGSDAGRSISAAVAQPTPHAAATLRILGASSSRTSAGRTFESSSPRRSRSAERRRLPRTRAPQAPLAPPRRHRRRGRLRRRARPLRSRRGLRRARSRVSGRAAFRPLRRRGSVRRLRGARSTVHPSPRPADAASASEGGWAPGRSGGPLFGDAGGLAAKLPQVVELGTANDAMALHFDLVQNGR